MKKRDYIPETQLGYLAWQDTFIPAASGIAGVIGLTPADLTALTTRNTDLHGKYATMQASQNAAKSATAAYNTSEADSRAADRVLVQRIKLNPGCTPPIAEELGITGAENTTDLTTSKPTL